MNNVENVLWYFKETSLHICSSFCKLLEPNNWMHLDQCHATVIKKGVIVKIAYSFIPSLRFSCEKHFGDCILKINQLFVMSPKHN